MAVSQQLIQSSISALEIAFHIKLSSQQYQIITYGHKTPVIVIACAGSGKTTILLFNIMFSIMTRQELPNNILGITFSKKAQLNMAMKYHSAQKQLSNNGYHVNTDTRPKFSTFDALFFHLIKSFPKYKDVRVLSSYTHIMYPLLHALVVMPKDISTKNEVQKIFELRSQLINKQLSYDGFHFIDYSNAENGLHQILSSMNFKASNGFIMNYLHVVHQYLKIKSQLHLIDFLDMKVLLLKILSNKNNHNHVLNIMQQYHLCFIDEFQDIDDLEWALVKKILPQKTLDALTVIGDDDQSIYSFRGSNPKIILNFTHDIPNAKRFDLSTNYRTNGHVLSAVRPLIENNKYRMTKDLRTNHTVPGGVYAFLTNKYASGGELLLHKVWKMYKSPKINNKDIVVLVRYNLDKMIATDWFANHGLFLGSNHLLQKNFVYKAIVSIIKSIYFDDLHSLNKWFKVLGFKQYQNHIHDVKQEYYPRINSLSLFIGNILKYDKQHKLLTYTGNIAQSLLDKQKHSNQAKKIVKIIKTDLNLKHAWNLRESKTQTGKMFFSIAESLVQAYFDFMVSHKYMSKNAVRTIETYLAQELEAYNDVSAFLESELNKTNQFQNLDDSNSNKISILTIHQSKGLQFKYVFLYNLSNLDVNTRYQHINWQFGPNISKSQFLSILLKLNKRAISYLDSGKSSLSYITMLKQLEARKQALLKYYRHGAKKRHYNYKEATKTEFIDELQQLAVNKLRHDDFEQTIQKKFNQLYAYTMNISSMVEEERRLIYVGFTRAEDSAVFNYNNNSNPLLHELNISKYHVMVSNKNHNIVPLIIDKNSQLKKVNSKILSLKKQRKDLINGETK